MLLAIGLFGARANAQGLLNRIKQKAGNIADKAVDKKTDELLNGKQKTANGSNGNPADNNSYEGGNSGESMGSGGAGSPKNKGGAGLITTPPDVNENLASAEELYKSATYGEARRAIQQAVLGVEMEIGQQLLKSLPASVTGLPVLADKDKVTSTGWGWSGLTIYREYLKDDRQLRMTIANNSILMSAVNMFLNGNFGQTSSSEQNWKQTKLKGHKAVIEYDEDSGYKLSVPVGQASLIVFEGVNFSNEPELMAAASQFDVDKIKNTLGEK